MNLHIVSPYKVDTVKMFAESYASSRKYVEQSGTNVEECDCLTFPGVRL